MNRMMTAAIAIALMGAAGCNQRPADDGNAASTVAAAGSIDGTWVADPASLRFESKPDNWTLRDGKYSCATCIPPIVDAAADGAFHPIADRATYDSMSVTVVDPTSVKFVRRKGDKESGNNVMTVSADGKTLTNAYNSLNNPNGKPTSGKSTFGRVGEPVAGAHAMSGQWAIQQVGDISPEALTMTYKLNGDVLTGTAGNGEMFNAKLDGTETEVTGAADGSKVSAVRDGAGYKLTFRRDGKDVDVVSFAVGADGKLSATSTDPRDGSKTMWTASRQ